MNFIKDRGNVCKSYTCGDRRKAEKVLFWLVHNSFQVHWFINHFFGFSIIVQKNHMIQVASCEQALIKTNMKPIQNRQSKKCLFRTYTLEFEFDRQLEHMVSYQGVLSGLSLFLVGEFGTFEILCKKWLFGRAYCSNFSNYKHQKYIIVGQNMIISSSLLITNQLYFASGLFVKLKT